MIMHGPAQGPTKYNAHFRGAEDGNGGEDMRFTVAVLPGDGVGPEVTAQAVRALEAVGARFGHTFNVVSGPIGGAAIDSHGDPLPPQTLAVCRSADAILFGAVGGPKWDDASAPVHPEDGILAIRKRMGLFANIRPVRAYGALAAASPLRAEVLSGVDMVIVRELTGGLYFARPKRRWSTVTGRRGVDTLRYAEREIERVMHVAFQMAQGRRRHVTSVDKFNVLETSRLWREVATEVGAGYPDVELNHMLVDNAAMQLVRQPSQFDVLVAENTFGDILSDEASVLTGSMGMLPSASLSAAPGQRASRGKVSLYEPIHGSAPDIAGRGIANPIASILSLAMLLRVSLGLATEANAVESAVAGAISEGYRTPDIAAPGGQTVSTDRMGEVIAGAI